MPPRRPHGERRRLYGALPTLSLPRLFIGALRAPWSLARFLELARALRRSARITRGTETYAARESAMRHYDGQCQNPGCGHKATWAYRCQPRVPVYCGRECRRTAYRSRQRAGTRVAA